MGAHTRARRRRGDRESVEENGAEVDVLLLVAGRDRRYGFAPDGGGRRERSTALQRYGAKRETEEEETCWWESEEAVAWSGGSPAGSRS